MKIIICPYSKRLPDGKDNPKNYPYWEEFVKLANDNGYECIQIAYHGEKPITGFSVFYMYNSLHDLLEMIEDCDTFVSVDTFFPHMCHYHNKYGVVIFGQSDPKIFGYPENINLLKDAKYLRPNQFTMWSNTDYRDDAFVSPQEILDAVNTILNR